jgi:Na+/proline symporter
MAAWWVLPVGDFLVILVIVLFWVRWREMSRARGYLTQADMAADLYAEHKSVLRILFAIIGIAAPTAHVILQLRGSALVLETLVGIPNVIGLIVLGIIVLIYTWGGGIRGVAWTDVVQGLMFLVLAVPVFLIIAGSWGLENIVSGLKNISPQLLELPGPKNLVTFSYMFGTLASLTFGWSLYPQIFNRSYMAKSRKHVYLAALSISLATFSCWLVGWSGLAARIFIPDLGVADNALPELLKRYFPTLSWIALLGVLMAALSTLDSILLSASQILTHDIYLRFINPKASEKRQVLVGRILVLLIIAISIYLGISPPAQILLIGLIGVSLMFTVGPALFIPFVWKGARGLPAAIGIVAHVIVLLLTRAPLPTAIYPNPLGISSDLWGVLVNLLIFLPGSVIMNRMGKAKKQ